LVALCAYLVRRTREVDALLAGVVTSVFNFIIPQIVKLLLLVEKHSTEGERQRSLYVKTTIFRWMVTVILTKALSEYRLTLSRDDLGLLPAIRGIFAAEIFIVPFFRYLDFPGFLSKHYFGPRAYTPDQMYLCFKGTPYNLAERYTDLTKIVFLSYYFCALYPMCLFFGSVALFFRHYIDKFLLLRTWREAPHSGTKLATFSTRYFLILAMILASFSAAYEFAFFRYDNICISEDTEAVPEYTNIDVTLSTGSIDVINVSSDFFVRVCTEQTCCQDQNVFHRMGLISPWEISPEAHESDKDFQWLSQPLTAQSPEFSFMYAVTAFAIMMIYIIYQFGRKIMNLFRSLYQGIYEPSGQNQNIDFTNVEGMHAYVPQITLGRFPFPLLFCKIDDIDEKLIGWTTFGEPYSDYNLIHDIQEIIDNSDDPNPPLFSDGPLFSFVTQWHRDFNAENKLD